MSGAGKRGDVLSGLSGPCDGCGKAGAEHVCADCYIDADEKRYVCHVTSCIDAHEAKRPEVHAPPTTLAEALAGGAVVRNILAADRPLILAAAQELERQGRHVGAEILRAVHDRGPIRGSSDDGPPRGDVPSDPFEPSPGPCLLCGDPADGTLTVGGRPICSFVKHLDELRAQQAEREATAPDVPPARLGAVYIAARYGRRLEALNLRGELEALGVRVTSEWVLGGHDQMPDDDCARVDLRDVDAADTVISLTEAGPSPGRARGGRHVEFGYGLAKGKRVILVGPRENVFHHLPDVEQFQSVAELLTVVRRTVRS